jgi:hypothetical protein
MSKKLPLANALMWIIGSALFCTGIFHLVLKSYLKKQYQKKHSPHYYLSRIVQTGPQRDMLSTTYLAELMCIAADPPTPIAYFNPSVAKKRLLSSPVIREASVKLIEPDTIYIDYTVRQPYAILDDFENTAIDEAGYPFPLFPFFSPKTLPRIYLGGAQIKWNTPILDKKLSLAFSILKFSSQFPFTLKRIDVEQAFADTLGIRGIVLIIEDDGFRRILRLSTKEYEQNLGNYLELRKELPEKAYTIDLRLSQLAFLKEKH